MVSKRKSSFKVKRIVTVVWSQRGNYRLRSKELTDACVHEAEAVSQGEIHHVRGFIVKGSPGFFITIRDFKRILVLIFVDLLIFQ